MLAGLQPAGAVAAGSGAMAWRFASVQERSDANRAGDRGRAVTALWNPREDGEVTLPVSVPQVRRVNAMGESVLLSAREGRVVVALRRGAVVYLVE